MLFFLPFLCNSLTRAPHSPASIQNWVWGSEACGHLSQGPFSWLNRRMFSFEMEFPDGRMDEFWILKGSAKMAFPKMELTYSPTNIKWCCHFSTLLSTLNHIISLLIFCWFDREENISLYCFNLHISHNWQGWALLPMFIRYFFWEIHVYILHFFHWVVHLSSNDLWDF